TSVAYRAYDDHHRGTVILMVLGCFVLVLPSYYDGKHRGAMDADFSC
ncbi:hypothetical protein A2U01_0096103, partial [Trifolium medium]|nr:hypothetical protein [Trifolium medium]